MARPRITLAEEQWALNLKHEIRNSKQFEAPQQNTELPEYVVSVLLLCPYRALCRPNYQNTKFKRFRFRNLVIWI